jgi:hypothetical protein
MKIRNLGVLSTLIIVVVLFLSACNKPYESTNESKNMAVADNLFVTTTKNRKLPKEFSKYWYQGKAEITSYELMQNRYGEVREGNAILVFVTEDFLPKEQVKADLNNPENIPVLKLNTTKNFLTGIYPYSIMTSTFYPVNEKYHAVKVSNSVQEWCGHVYAQLNNRQNFEITAHSYFQKEADQNFSLEKNFLEDEIWTQIRLNPDELPQGDLSVIPSMEYIRLNHIPFKAYKAKTYLSKNKETSVYTIEYPSLDRSLSIEFATNFPYNIVSWEESKGILTSTKKIITKAVKKQELISAYWQKNSNDDVHLRDSLGI